MPSVFFAAVLSAVAGVMNGSFAAPTKYVRKWQWENIWSVWAIFGMIVVPWILVAFTIPHAGLVFRGISARETVLLIVFGVGFGLAQIFFGLGIAAVGIALNFAIAIGISTAFGSVVPFLSQHSRQAFSREGLFFFLGIILMLAGIVLSALAGREKEKRLRSSAMASSSDSSKKRMSFAAGLTLCILAGLGSPLGNFGAAFCTSTVQRAAQFGAGANKYNAIWAPLYTAAFVPYLIYCIYLWRKNRSFRQFGESGTGGYWLYGLVMGSLWMGSSAIYGVAIAPIGKMGPALGWPLFMSVIIITSTVWGFLTGEWKGAGRKAGNTMVLAIVFLILGFATLAYSGTL